MDNHEGVSDHWQDCLRSEKGRQVFQYLLDHAVQREIGGHKVLVYVGSMAAVSSRHSVSSSYCNVAFVGEGKYMYWVGPSTYLINERKGVAAEQFANIRGSVVQGEAPQSRDDTEPDEDVFSDELEKLTEDTAVAPEDFFGDLEPGRHWKTAAAEYDLEIRRAFEACIERPRKYNYRGKMWLAAVRVKSPAVIAAFAEKYRFLIPAGESETYFFFEYEGHGRAFRSRFGTAAMKADACFALVQKPGLEFPEKMPDIVFRSKAMLRATELAEQAARHQDVSVLIVGESGTGKEFIANLIHNTSPRSKGPFVPLTCAMPEGLIESELYGNERGAYTGADTAKPGAFERAEGGTLFLDEVGDLPQYLQVKLLRALQERKIRRLGGKKEVTVDIRVVAATNVDLLDAISTGRFREDLYHRLRVITIRVPALRERPEDVAVIAWFFLQKYARRMDCEVIGIDPATFKLLSLYHWPGNVRELENNIIHALVLAQQEGSPSLMPRHFPLVSDMNAEENARVMAMPMGTMDDMNRLLIQKALLENSNNVKRAAKVLGIDPVTLRRRCQKYSIEI